MKNKNKQEQYLFVSFGLSNIKAAFTENSANGGVLIALGYKYFPESNKYLANNVLFCSNLNGHWGNKFPIKPQEFNHFQISVKGTEYTLSVNNKERYIFPLPDEYNGGEIAIGTNAEDALIKNICLQGKPVKPYACGFATGMTWSAMQNIPLRRFYRETENGYIRKAIDSGSFTSNGAMLLLGETTKDFIIEFDAKFFNCCTAEDFKDNTTKDPFEEYTFGPFPVKNQLERVNCGNIHKIEKNDDYIAFSFFVKGIKMKLYLSLPDFGGVRISDRKPICSINETVEKTAVFQPKALIKLNNDENFTRLVGSDGTRAELINDDFWHIDLYDKFGNFIVSVNQYDLSFSEESDMLKQYRLLLPLGEKECIFGTGERFNGLNQRGKKIAFWNTDIAYINPENKDYDLWRGYKNVPLMHSSCGYSVFINSTCHGIGDFGCDDPSEIRLTFDDNHLDMYFWCGTICENIIKYTDLTGKQILPPIWAFEYMAGGSNGFWYQEGERIPEKYTTRLKEMIEGYEKLGAVPSAIYCEGDVGLHPISFDLCKKHNLKILTWQDGEMSRDWARDIFSGYDDCDIPLVHNIYHPKDDMYRIIDFTHPEVGRLMRAAKWDYLEQGLRGGMVDFAERAPVDGLYANGLAGDRMHNFYPYFYAKGYHDLYKSKWGDDFIAYIRGGCAGSQKWLCTWCGDQFASFDGIRQQLAAGLSISTSGFSFWGSDMAGLVGKPDDELMIRSIQFSTFQPLMRAGGDMTKQPWDYSDSTVNVFIKHFWLRKNLLKSIYSYAIYSHISGSPMTKAMAVSYPEFTRATGLGTQYMFCDSILFVPVLEAGTKSIEVAFPKGLWYSLFDESIIAGETIKRIPVALDYSPAFLKSGTVLPVTTDKNMNLFSPFDADSSLEVLLITPPEGIHTYKHYNTEGESLILINELKADGVCQVKSDTKRYKGICFFEKAKSVKSDGNELVRMPSIAEVVNYSGYTVIGNKTYIFINDGFENIEILF